MSEQRVLDVDWLFVLPPTLRTDGVTVMMIFMKMLSLLQEDKMDMHSSQRLFSALKPRHIQT